MANEKKGGWGKQMSEFVDGEMAQRKRGGRDLPDV